MTATRIVKLFDYVFVLRPTLFLPVWTGFATGYFAAERVLASVTHLGAASQSNGALVVLGWLTLLMGSSYILNQLCDIETDQRNGKLFLISEHHVSIPAAWVELLLLLVVSVAAAWQYDGMMAGLFIVIFVFTGVVYSVYPFQWKDRPLLGVFANCAGAIMVFYAGWWTLHQDMLAPLQHAAPYGLAVAAVYLYTTLLDLKGDAATDKNTFAVRFGWRATAWAGALLELLALLLATLNKDPILFFPALLGTPFYLLAAARLRQADISRAIKLPIVFLSLAICVKVWQYALVLAALYYLSRWYYRVRFGLRYPSLQPD